MIGRTLAIAMNTYREAVRARVLLGLLAFAVCVSLYSLVIDGAVVLGILAGQASERLGSTLGAAGGLLAVLGFLLFRAKHSRVFVVLPWSLAAFALMALLASSAGGERQVLIVSTVLTIAEVCVVTAVAMLFSSFSSPFLTAIFTVMV